MIYDARVHRWIVALAGCAAAVRAAAADPAPPATGAPAQGSDGAPAPPSPWLDEPAPTPAPPPVTTSTTAPATAGQSAAGQSAAGQSAAGQSAAGQSAAGQSAAGQSAAGKSAEESARLAAVAACEGHDPACDWLAGLTKLERQSVMRALDQRHLKVDPQPWGKVIERVEVFNDKVFAEGGSFIEFFNHFHVVTSEAAIRDELTIVKGEVWDQLRVDESARRLHDPLYSSVVAAIPAISDQTNQVVLLVVTRDIFSIRLNTNYTYQQGTLTNLTISLSDNNFFGTRNLVAAAMGMDEGSISFGPQFLDKNLAAEHIVVNASGGLIFTRQALPIIPVTGPEAGMVLPPLAGDPTGIQDAGRFHYEGSFSSINVSKPLWALASQWAWGLSFGHGFGVSRVFEGTNDGLGLFGYVDRNSAVTQIVPEEYEIHRINASATVQRQWGTVLKQQLSGGYTLGYQSPFFLPNFPADPMLRADFARDVMPPKQTDSAPYIEYSFFEPRYSTARNIQTYDLAEDLQYGANLDSSIQVGLTELGSTADFVRYTLSGGYSIPWGRDGFIHGGVSGSVRRQGGTYIDNTASYGIRVQTPSTRYGRIILQQSLFTRWHDTQNAIESLGSDSGLRGYNVAEFLVTGSGRIFLGQIEARSAPIPIWVLRLGAVVFYDIGSVSNTLANSVVFDDIGGGIRFLVPQTSRLLFRFDFAFPLQTDPIRGGTVAGQLHFIAGFDSYF